jgi:RNA polymerase sigma-70 factor (ECF subfamily)
MFAISEAANLKARCIPIYEGLGQQSNAECKLVRQLQAGNESVFRDFVERYQSKVCGVAYGILGNREDADDVAQQVFVKVYFSIKSFEGRSALYTWLHRITVNKCYEFLRKRRLVASLGTGSGHDDNALRGKLPADPSPASETLVVQRDFLNKLLLRIPERDRHLLLLRELEGYSIAQLSEATGLNENTIKVRLFRTRQQLIAATLRLNRRPRKVTFCSSSIPSR